MLKKWLHFIISKRWLRVTVAVVFLLVGVAPVGAPILSDSAFREALQPGEAQPDVQPVAYRWVVGTDGVTRIQRNEHNAETAAPGGFLGLGHSTGQPDWKEVGSISDEILQIGTTRADQQLVLARGKQALWRSHDGGETWEQASLNSRALSIALAQKTPGLVFVGTESAGLYRSLDGGETWQSLYDSLAGGGAGILGVSAVTINPDDEQVVYAASGYWLGTSELHYTPVGVYASVDSGTHWFEMVEGADNASNQGNTDMVQTLKPVAQRPLAVSAGAGSKDLGYELPVTPALQARLDDPDTGVSAAVARVLGLSGNHSVLPALLAHLHTGDALVGDRMAEAIGLLDDPAAVPVLRMALSDQDEAVRARAAYALGMLKVEDVVPQLAEMLRSDGAVAQSRAAGALATIGTPAATQALIAPLASPEVTPARHAAMSGLETVGQGATTELTAALHDQNATLRQNAAEVLGWIAAPSATDGLVQTLSDSVPAVRSEAAWALGQIGTPQAQRALAQAAQVEQDQAVRQSTQQALAEAQAAARERSDLALTPGVALLDAANRVPVTSWTFLALAIALAAGLLASKPPRFGTRQTGS